ncbi:MAG: hypothetical protein U0441_01265 [Polyangiaceae bacterium]
MSTRRITESGMTLEVPEDAHFRFEETKTYEKLGGCGIKEMDVVFLDRALGCTILVELTHYTKEGEAPVEKKLRQEITTKARDSLLLLQAVWRGYGAGRDLASEVRAACRSESRLRVVFVVKVSPEHKSALNPTALSNMSGLLKRDIFPVAGLLGLKLERHDIYLCDETEAVKLLPLTVEPST